jgi:3-oxoacyl-[acyl-carrier protein] reductase
MLGSMGPLAEASLSEFAEVLEVNVTAQVAIVQALLDGMKRRRRGVIVWLSSGLGRFGVPGYGAYCASKHAVEGLMKIVAEEHTADGIVSVAVAPGMVATDMLRAALGQEDVSEHQTPEETALAFVAMAESLSEEHSGGSLDIAPWLQ